MSSIVKIALLAVGGVTLFGGSFVGVSLVSGRKPHEIPLLKTFVHKPEAPHSEHPEVAGTEHEPGTDPHAAPTGPETEPTTKEPGSEHASVVRHATQEDTPTAASVLGAFVMPAPFNGDELAQMQSKLALRLEEVDVDLAKAKDKLRELDERERALNGREKELQTLKNELDTRSKELTMREMELGRDADAAAAQEEKSWHDLARFFQEGEIEELVKKLVTFTPTDAAKILHQLDDERAVELVNALPQDQYKTFLDAYRKSVK